MANKEARIVIIGGGFGGLFTALELKGAGHVTLISEEDHFTFRPLLYEYLSGEVEAWHIAPYYKELLDDEIQILRGVVTNIDFEAREVVIKGREQPLGYDVLVLSAGSITNYWNIEGAEEYAMPFRGIADSDALRQRMIDALDRVAPDLAPQDVRRALTFAVVGGGASGVELSTKMSDLLRDAFERRALPGEPRVLVIEMTNQVVPGMGEDIREYVTEALSEKRVEIHTETRVVRVMPDGLVLDHSGEQTEIKTAATVWTAGVRVSPLIEKLDLAKDRRQLIIVRETLQVEGHENIFALADIAQCPNVAPQLAGTAQLAFQQATLTAHNIRALIEGRPLKTKHFEELGEALSLGTDNAAILAEGRAFGGALARKARFALYTGRQPTWHHRLKVGASWFFEGTTPRPLQPLGIKR
ncbi:MAG TPA: NAD(P)/FAD-dependent oxidoreductase [Pyrinomonadaceae bacterium]|jgi:NADH dehydrogenase